MILIFMGISCDKIDQASKKEMILFNLESSQNRLYLAKKMLENTSSKNININFLNEDSLLVLNDSLKSFFYKINSQNRQLIIVDDVKKEYFKNFNDTLPNSFFNPQISAFDIITNPGILEDSLFIDKQEKTKQIIKDLNMNFGLYLNIYELIDDENNKSFLYEKLSFKLINSDSVSFNVNFSKTDEMNYKLLTKTLSDEIININTDEQKNKKITKSIKGKIIEIDEENNILIDFEELPNMDQFNEIVDVSLSRFYSGLNWEKERFNDIKKFLDYCSINSSSSDCDNDYLSTVRNFGLFTEQEIVSIKNKHYNSILKTTAELNDANYFVPLPIVDGDLNLFNIINDKDEIIQAKLISLPYIKIKVNDIVKVEYE
ncbi:MAG: hypothetical protein CMF89_02650 [Candidatus Marinimicrobia bacterium]|nr:hypothetical protein [Candidatus Neomarinimicrobiota bacterium]